MVQPAYANMKLAREAIKKLPGGVWVWADNPGDGKRFAVFRCNMHLNCPKLVRAAKCDNEFILQEKGEHAEELNQYKRKNSALTLEQERILKVAADSGGKPAGVLVSLSKTKMKEMRAAGLNPLDKKHKREDGGLIGTLHRVCINSVSTVYQRMYHSVSCSVSWRM